jgi:hypothetical protein
MAVHELHDLEEGIDNHFTITVPSSPRRREPRST